MGFVYIIWRKKNREDKVHRGEIRCEQRLRCSSEEQPRYFDYRLLEK
jgi:hypothetical protein